VEPAQLGRQHKIGYKNQAQCKPFAIVETNVKIVRKFHAHTRPSTGRWTLSRKAIIVLIYHRQEVSDLIYITNVGVLSKHRTIDNVQKRSNCVNLPSSGSFRSVHTSLSPPSTPFLSVLSSRLTYPTLWPEQCHSSKPESQNENAQKNLPKATSKQFLSLSRISISLSRATSAGGYCHFFSFLKTCKVSMGQFFPVSRTAIPGCIF
jgi:hypothetical protein